MHGKEVLSGHLSAIQAQVQCTGLITLCESSSLLQLLNLGHVSKDLINTQPALENPAYFSCAQEDCELSFFRTEKNVLWITLSLSSISTNTNNQENTQSNTQNNKRHNDRKKVVQYKNSDLFYIGFEYQDAVPEWLTSFEQDQWKDQQTLLLTLLRTCAGIAKMTISHEDLMVDPLTKLDPRSVLQHKTNIIANEYSVACCLVYCREFQELNKQYGKEVGDKLIASIANTLDSSTREDDIVSRFGGVLFGVACITNGIDETEIFAHKLQRSLNESPLPLELKHISDEITLSFHVGASTVGFDEPSREDIDKATVLVNRAEQALTAAQSHQDPAVVVWQETQFSTNHEQFNYLGGIFTNDSMTNYRNMLLLWDISMIIADEFEFEKLLRNVIKRLASTFDFHSAGLWRKNPISYSVSEFADVATIDSSQAFAREYIEEHIPAVLQSGKQQIYDFDEHIVWILPLEVESDECFYLVGDASRFLLSHDTKVLIQGFARQLGKALRRSQLEEELNKRLESQNAKLEHELRELKDGLSSSALVYKSRIMQTLMKQTERAASTDTTVLITGESGTGKERLINAIHTLGPRAKKPLVIVDCGSIPETLIESELFGYTKGAFTGAQNSTKGKIQEADGGILVLDEIGELPLHMQPKLLRFVQEKHYTPLGGTKTLAVDVKIVAVTNRNLSFEVEQGRFRKDLYYRLNVVTLNNPPLRDRGEDIALLAQHFIHKFALQFNTGKKYFAKDALIGIEKYSWPGNIREMENKLMQATLLSDNEYINADELNFEINENANTTVAEQPFNSSEKIDTSQVTNTENNTDDEEPTTTQPLNSEDVLFNINQQTEIFLKEIEHQARFMHISLGQSVEKELCQLTYQACEGNLKLLAIRLQLPISTARRKMNKFVFCFDKPTEPMPETWQNVKDAIMPIAQGEVIIPNCLENIKLTLLTVILNSKPNSMSRAADLLGVSEPTFYKLKKQLYKLVDLGDESEI